MSLNLSNISDSKNVPIKEIAKLSHRLSIHKLDKTKISIKMTNLVNRKSMNFAIYVPPHTRIITNIIKIIHYAID